MLKNYIIIAIRNIQNSPVYSSINVIGLTIGIVSSLLLYLYIDFERSYDNFHSNGTNIYRVTTAAKVQDTEFNIPLAPSLIGATLKNEYGAVENFVRITGQNELLVAVGEDYFYEKNMMKTDSSFFEVLILSYSKAIALHASVTQIPWSSQSHWLKNGFQMLPLWANR